MKTKANTDKKVTSNRPYITLVNKRDNKIYLIDISILNTSQIPHTSKKIEQVIKYTPLSIEIKEETRRCHKSTTRNLCDWYHH